MDFEQPLPPSAGTPTEETPGLVARTPGGEPTGAAGLRAFRGLRSLWILLVAAIVLATIGALTMRRSRTANAAAPVPPLAVRRVACLGHLEPEDGVIVLSARSLTGQPSIVADVRVKEGDVVTAGQALATLNSRDQLEAAWREAEARVVLARKQLAQVEAGAKPADVAAQEAEIARLESELTNAEAEYRRSAALYADQIASQADLDATRARMEAARQFVQQAKNRLRSLAEVRKTDLDAAQAAVAAALANARRARTEYEPSLIRAPVTGRVIKIHARPGEEVGPRGLLEMGKTERMYTIAEVPESDVARVKVGDPATITGDALESPLNGVVAHIGLKVDRGQIVETDPAAFVDARVVEVKVRLYDARRAERMIHAQVRVLINP